MKMSKAKITIVITPWTVFVALSMLKLMGWCKWSWWTVTSPLWAPVALLLAVMFIVCLICYILEIFKI